ncbi:hypothetical protein CDD82_4246 [Ophiocordyceps australis]|uniref:Phosphoglycerate mutase family protein n=1 Tax=Ophiocordyceps australis TaxID=1399860 RepID=A0A2C5ZSY1_9HYPO|nr:hypothetical protein CDD82_4246 [Ophiocordyceps australis]
MAPTIHLVRHAQGVHNLSVANESIHDPDVTALGQEQCAALGAAFPYHASLKHLVASPLRRTITTCLAAFGHGNVGPVVALDVLQEVSAAPCDVGSAPEVLQREFGSQVDLAGVRAAWTDKGPGSVFEPTVDKLTARASEARRALRDLVRGEEHLVAVTHGGFLHFLTDDWQGIPEGRATGWDNCECRSYQFADPTGEDDDALLIETDQSRARRHFGANPLSPQEKRELRAAVQRRLVPHLKINQSA